MALRVRTKQHIHDPHEWLTIADQSIVFNVAILMKRAAEREEREREWGERRSLRLRAIDSVPPSWLAVVDEMESINVEIPNTDVETWDSVRVESSKKRGRGGATNEDKPAYP